MAAWVLIADWGNGVVKVTVGDSMVSESKLVVRVLMSTLEDPCCSAMIVCSYLLFCVAFNVVNQCASDVVDFSDPNSVDALLAKVL